MHWWATLKKPAAAEAQGSIQEHSNRVLILSSGTQTLKRADSWHAPERKWAEEQDHQGTEGAGERGGEGITYVMQAEKRKKGPQGDL